MRTASPPGCDADMVSNFELKSFDGCANPHLGLAAIIAAGMDGLRNHFPLPEPIGKSVVIRVRLSRLGQRCPGSNVEKVLLCILTSRVTAL